MPGTGSVQENSPRDVPHCKSYNLERVEDNMGVVEKGSEK